MKKLFIIIFTLVLFTLLFADGTPAEGSGTSIDPYQIETLDNLLWLSTTQSVWGNSIYFIQTQDIDASDTENWNDGEGFSPIGYGNWDFHGNYNGSNHLIENLYINRPYTWHQSLFGRTIGANIEALGVTNVNITGDEYVSALVGVGQENTTITGCYGTGIVNGNRKVGGLIGIFFSSTLSESYASVNVTGNETIGGLVGRDFNCTIWQSHYDYETVLINDQHYISIGALTSELYNAWINNNMLLDINEYLSYDGEHYLINCSEDLEKLLAFGQNSDYSFLLTANIDLISNPNFYIPRFVGSFNGDNHIIDGLNVNIPTFYRIGLFGYIYGATIEALGATNVNVIGFSNVGGLIGSTSHSTISGCFSTGSVSGELYIGGLVGANGHSTISECYATSIVDGFGKVGGLLGVNFISSLSNSYQTGNVYGFYDAGGLVGKNENSDISNCYSTGSMDGVNISRLGGLVGYNISEATIDNCIWNIENSGQTNGVGPQSEGTITNLLAATTAEMQLMSTYTDIGWDFVGENVNGTEDIWNINEIANNGIAYINDLEWALNEDFYANFIADPTSGFAPVTVNFEDESVAPASTIVSWEWDFQNDGVIDSYEQYPAWIYTEPGLYSVCLTISDEISRNTSTIVKEDYVEIIAGGFVPEGSGTEDDPYLISNLDNLFWLSTCPAVWASANYFLQTQDIDASGTQNWNDGAGFSPIGPDPFIPFQGVYNGDNHVIDGLYINRYNEAFIGFIGWAYGAVIEALGLTNIYVSGMCPIGGVVGYSYDSSIVRKCYTTGTITGDSFIGGVVGQNDNYSTVTECYSECDVTGEIYNIGGLVGINSWSSLITESYATGYVTGNYDNTGGLVGYNFENSRISDCYATGNVTGDHYVGGLVGKNTDNSIISNNYSSGNVSGNNAVGSLVGFNDAARIENCIWNMETSGLPYGVWFDSGTIINMLGKTTAEMQMMSTYTDIGWDFAGEITGTEDIWDIENEINNGYPYILAINGLNADFRAIPTYGITPLAVDFVDESILQSSAIVTWEWDFENDGVIDSYEQDPSWLYTEPGLYSVCLTVYDEITRNISTSVKEDYIAVIDGNFIPEGSGTEDDPYLITNLDNLSWLSAYQTIWASSVYFLQTQDIDATDTVNWHNGIGFSPIGLSSNNPFQGYYNGANHVIDGLFINRHEDSFVGLFGSTSGAVIEALGVTNIEVAGSNFIGGLVGYNDNSSISECYAAGNVTGGLHVGGIVGQNCNYSTIAECYAACCVSGIISSIGGLVGYNYDNSSISDCYATSSVSGTIVNTGGLVGANNFDSSISKCFSTGNVSGSTICTGGFVGENRNGSQIVDCVWNTETSGQTNGFGGNSAYITNLLGKTEAEMQIMSTFTDIDWDFAGEIINGTEDLWDIDSALNNCYPYISDLVWSLCDSLFVIFAATPTSGMLPLTVNFFDVSASGNPITSWQWDFENDGVIDSYEQHPTWVYDEPGLFSVSLTVSDDIERDTVTELKENYIEVFSEIDYGDIDNNAVVDSYDAALLLMYVVGLDPLPEDPVPWEAWRLLCADVDVNSEIDALDAAYILQYVVAIITELPVTRICGNPEIAISLSNDSKYIYLNSDKQLISLEYKIIESRNLIAGKAETEREDCQYYQNEQHLALISAVGISGNILKIPYERTGNTDCSLVFEFECNGFIENIDYTLTDPVPFITRLNSICPNPFNPVTNISFMIGESGDIQMSIYNIKGQKVETLADGYYETGEHTIIWDAEKQSSGVYFIYFNSGSLREVKKITLLK